MYRLLLSDSWSALCTVRVHLCVSVMRKGLNAEGWPVRGNGRMMTQQQLKPGSLSLNRDSCSKTSSKPWAPSDDNGNGDESGLENGYGENKRTRFSMSPC